MTQSKVPCQGLMFKCTNIDKKSEIKDFEGTKRYVVAENYSFTISSLYKGSVIYKE